VAQNTAKKFRRCVCVCYQPVVVCVGCPPFEGPFDDSNRVVLCVRLAVRKIFEWQEDVLLATNPFH
jgi:hypothetical protein